MSIYKLRYTGEKIDEQLGKVDDKQDALVSGKNIKTINGESIVGGGDITVATMSEVNTAIANAITNAINASY